MIEASVFTNTRLKTVNGYHSLLASRLIKKGELICEIDGIIGTERTMYSIQIGPDAHIEAYRPEGILAETTPSWRFMNHSCDSNTYIRFPDRMLIALRDIQPGEEFSYNYLTTEDVLSCPFECGCGSEHCVGVVRGNKFLTPAQRARIENITAPHLFPVPVMVRRK